MHTHCPPIAVSMKFSAFMVSKGENLDLFWNKQVGCVPEMVSAFSFARVCLMYGFQYCDARVLLCFPSSAKPWVLFLQ